MNVDWGAVWAFVWPILKEAFIAFLMALLALLGYDQVVPSRYGRREPAQDVEGLRKRVAALERKRGA